MVWASPLAKAAAEELPAPLLRSCAKQVVGVAAAAEEAAVAEEASVA